MNINTQVVLLPPSSGDVATIDPFQAIDAASAHMDKTLDPTALLARVTVPGTIPPSDSPVPFRAIEDRLAWVVTFTLDKPEEANLGKPQAGLLWVTHYSAVLDADSGEFLTGFFTA